MSSHAPPPLFRLTADALDDVALEALLVVERLGLREEGPLGVDPDDDEGRVALLELARDASQRAAGPGAAAAGREGEAGARSARRSALPGRADSRHHDHVDLALARIPDLLGRPVVVRQGVARVAVLVQDVRARDLLRGGGG